MEYALETVIPPGDLAAVLVEPVLGEGGYVIPPATFLQQVRAFCDRHGAAFIADEVQSGFGRTGRWFAIEHWGIEPDVICIAKAAGGGLPLGGIIARGDLMDRWPAGAHGTTFGGNLVACAAGLATIAVIQRERLLERVTETGTFMLQVLQRAAKDLHTIEEVRGLGLMIGVSLRGTQDVPGLVRKVVDLAARKGLLVIPSGHAVIRLSPPLILTREAAEMGTTILIEAIREASSA
jgi:4-aminobutyrate aminotransferase